MAFFPREIMPLTPKLDSPASSTGGLARITAGQYNLHDTELRAVEQFLGVQPYSAEFGTPRQESGDKASSPVGTFQSGLLGDVGRITDQLNAFALDGVCVMSGYVSSGGIMTFPENIGASYLTQTPGPHDVEINVSSTAGFPQEGVISIINDVRQVFFDSSNGWQRSNEDGVTTVEWIRYSGKTSTSFTGCQRGFLGTTKGPHAGGIEMPFTLTSTDDENLKDLPVNAWQSVTPYVTRRYRGWRRLTTYKLAILGLVGSRNAITDAVRTLAATFRVSPGYDAAQLNAFMSAANAVGILGTRSSGAFFLQSADPSHASDGILEPDEALDFVQECINRGIMVTDMSPDEFKFPQAGVPVFRGKMGLSVSPVVTGTALAMSSTQVFIDASARVMVFSDEDRTIETGDVGLANYSMFHVPSLTTMLERGS